MDDWTVRRIINEEKNKPDGCGAVAGLFLLFLACVVAWVMGTWTNSVGKRLDALEQKASIVKEQP